MVVSCHQHFPHYETKNFIIIYQIRQIRLRNVLTIFLIVLVYEMFWYFPFSIVNYWYQNGISPTVHPCWLKQPSIKVFSYSAPFVAWKFATINFLYFIFWVKFLPYSLNSSIRTIGHSQMVILPSKSRIENTKNKVTEASYEYLSDYEN